MKYVKLENGKPSYAPNPIKINGCWWSNPPASILMEQGYKPVVYNDPPGDAPSGYQWSEIWSEDDGNIQQGWELVEVPITEEDALVRYANELTGSADETLAEATETLIKLFKEEE